MARPCSSPPAFLPQDDGTLGGKAAMVAPPGSRTPTKQRLHSKIASPYANAQTSPAVSLPGSPGVDSPPRYYDPPQTGERLAESAQLERLRGSDAFVGLAPLRERASEAFSGVMSRTQGSGRSATRTLGLSGPLSKSAPDILPSIHKGRTPQMERAVAQFLGRREQLEVTAETSETRAEEARRKMQAKRSVTGDGRSKKYSAAVERVKASADAAQASIRALQAQLQAGLHAIYSGAAIYATLAGHQAGQGGLDTLVAGTLVHKILHGLIAMLCHSV